MTTTRDLLPGGARRVHRALIEAVVATGAVPTPAELADSLGLPTAELDACLAVLVEADYLGRDGAGRITCLYPFSPAPTSHVVILGSVRRFAMCSIDALGIAAMLGRPVTIEGSCAECAASLRIEVEPGRIALVEPAGTVVIARRSGAEQACAVCCPGTLFACGPAHGRAIAERATDSEVVPLDEALRHAESIFAGLLGETLPARRPRSAATTARLRT